MKINPKILLFSLLLIYSPALAQRFQTFTRFELGGGAIFLIPREDYNNGWGMGLGGVWNFSRRYGIHLAYGTTKVKTQTSGDSRKITSIVGSLEISFRRGDSAHGFTSFGFGGISGEKNTLFTFGAGLKIPFKDRFLCRIELRDYHTEIGIPFITFPRGRIALQGRTSRYLEIGLGIAYTFDEIKRK